MRALVVAGALLFTLSACSPLRQPPATSLWAERPPSAGELRQVLEARRRALHSLRSEVLMTFSGPDGAGSAHEVVAVERPDHLRIEVLTLFGTPFVLATADGALAAYVRGENRVYRGAATPANLVPYTRVDLSVRDVVELLLGNPPLREVGHGSVFFDAATAQLRLRQETAGGAQVVAFAGDPLVPVAAEEIGQGDRLLWRAEFGRHTRIQNVSVPLHLRLDVPGSAQSVRIELHDPEINPALVESLFALQAPPGSEEVWLD